ncbi:MAG: hypothetical protein R3290_01605 [Acidimicrobiia bacterium]|nr:hypothetical protein [Acidimicrobiia bacterium]
MVEILGWAASALIVLSLTMTSILRLRVIGLAGAVTFATYGVLIGAWPVAIVNGVIVLIHLWYLRRLLFDRSGSFRLLEVGADSDYLRDFLDFYDEELAANAPGFVFRPEPGQQRWFVLADMVPAGLIVGTWVEPGTLRVDLDFAIPQYRDLRLGRFAFSAAAGLAGERAGSITVRAEAGTDRHAAYLRAIGFEALGEGAFRKRLPESGCHGGEI